MSRDDKRGRGHGKPKARKAQPTQERSARARRGIHIPSRPFTPTICTTLIEPKRRALWAACAVSWVFGIASAPYVWRLFQWFGERTGVPKLVWELGFGLWWTIPALFALIVLLMEKVRQGGEPDWIRQSK